MSYVLKYQDVLLQCRERQGGQYFEQLRVMSTMELTFWKLYINTHITPNILLKFGHA